MPALLWTGACGGEGETPADPGPSGPLVVIPDSVLITELGGEAPILATIGGESVQPVLTLRSDDRWLDDVPVVDPVELARARISAESAGRAIVEARVGERSDSVVVSVRPSDPVVIDVRLPDGRRHLGDPDTLVLRGFGMDSVSSGDVVVAGSTVWLQAVDSANVLLVVPTADPGGCQGTPPPLEIGFVGIPGPTVGGLTRRRAGEITLGRGEAHRIPPAEAGCLRIAPFGSAEYVLAYVDRRLVDQARTGPEFPWPDSIRILAEDVTGSVSSTGAPTPWYPPTDPARPHHSELAVATGASLTDPLPLPPGCPFDNHNFAFCRAAPYTLGETFTYYPEGTNRPAGPARIVGLRGNLALSVFQADSGMLAIGALARADSAMVEMRDEVLPELRTMYRLSSPTTTSDESGQLLVTLEQASQSFARKFPDATNGHGRWGKVTLHVSPTSGFGREGGEVASMLLIMAHEVAHTYQFRWRHEHASPWLTYLGTGWAVEGGATFVSLEAVRESLGVPFDANHDVNSLLADDPLRIMRLVSVVVGDFTRGYSVGASLLRDLVQRLVVDGGMTVEAASSEVLLGAMEGWWGINEEGWSAGPGLTARMRQRLGPSWTPEGALLDWTMSQVADDLTSNPRYQNITVRSDTSPTVSTNTGGSVPIVGGGGSAVVTRAPGNTGAFLLMDSEGGSYRTEGTAGGQTVDVVEWLILRIS